MGSKKYISKIIIAISFAILFNIAAPINTSGNKAEKSSPFYSMYVNDIEVGTVKYAAWGLSLYDTAVEELYKSHQDKITIEGTVLFREVDSVGQDLNTEEELIATISQSVDIFIDSYALVVDDKEICYLKTEEEAQEVIEKIQKPYIDSINKEKDHKLENVSLMENIKTDRKRVLIGQLVDVDYAVQLITVGEAGPREYTVKQGDTAWSISRSFGITLEDIEGSNPGIDIENLQIGQKLNIMEVKSLVTVVTDEMYTYKEVIPFETVTKNDSSMYIGESKITTKGKDGEKEIKVKITKENGREIKREVISEKVIKKPTTQIVNKGTKKRPVTPPTTSRSGNNRFTRPNDLTPISKKGVEMTHWDTAKNLFTRGSVAKVTHFDTGYTFYVYRLGGTLHADVEPLTAADTEVMRKIYGSWSWRRESIIVEVNGKKMAGSMNCMPHGGKSIYNNNYGGHFCIHFYGSLTHETYRLDPDHQAAIKRVVK